MSNCEQVQNGQSGWIRDPECRIRLANDADLDPTYMDNTLRNFCERHPNLEECKCYQRSRDPAFRTLAAELGPVNPGCWYEPCRQPNKIWRPPGINSSQCPDICQAVLRVVQDGKVTEEDISQTVQCNFGTGPAPRFRCREGKCQAEECVLGEPNCYDSPDCGLECQVLNYRCQGGLCIQAPCNIGEPNCFPEATCNGECASNYACPDCRVSDCNINAEGCFPDAASCTCSTNKSKGIPWVTIAIVSASVLTVLIIAFLILK